MVIAALLPPPAPMVPFVIVAGAMQYPSKKFIAALALGRATRYSLLALLAAYYGRQIIGFITHNRHPYMFAALGVASIVAVVVVLIFAGKKKKHKKA